MKIARGAEAIIYKEKDTIIKDRVIKTYRHTQLDAVLRKRRTKSEAKILNTLIRHIKVPKVIEIKDNILILEYIPGVLVKEILDSNVSLAKKIGWIVGKMHDLNIVHQDLTTSNMIYVNEEIVLIDFGLAFQSIKYEDKAVDLHIFKQALESKHHKIADVALKEFFKGYKPKDLAKIKERFEIVEQRGRNKAKY